MDFIETVRASGLEDRDIQTISNYYERLCGLLPSKEYPTASFISRQGKVSSAELYFFTNSFLIHVLEFQNANINREIKFSIYPLKNSILSLRVESKEEFRETPVTLSIDVNMIEGKFSFIGQGENSIKLKRISEEIFFQNIKNGESQ
jgi:hypothetical protein